MKLHQAFEISPGDVVAFIGSGGKTSTMVSLGYELAEMGWRVLATTTTHIGQEQLELMPRALMVEAGSMAISDALTSDHFVFLYDRIYDGKVFGPAPQNIPTLIDAVDSDVILIEADIAHGMPLKAMRENEPIIPPETSLVIPLASLSALGDPLDEAHVYNMKAILDRFGYVENNRIKSAWIAQILRDDKLTLKGIPENARIVPFLNQAMPRGYGRARSRLIARLTLKNPRVSAVAIGSVRGAEPVYEVHRPVGAVVLAAGMSTRMGESKVMLPWTARKTIIEHIVEQLINSKIEHIVVVTGHMAKEVKDLLAPYGVKVVFNRSYKTGEMLSSLKAGLRGLPDHVAATLVVLGDQPRIQPKVIYQVLTAYAENAGEIIIPSYRMQRGHPVLISRRFFPEMLNLTRNHAPRDVINAHKDEIHYIEVDTDSVLRDVDTPQDYAEERWKAGLK